MASDGSPLKCKVYDPGMMLINPNCQENHDVLGSDIKTIDPKFSVV